MQLIPALLLLSLPFSFAQFSLSAKDAIVDVHNELRSSIARGTFEAKGFREPPAADMLKMKWDSSVGTSAQNYANSCPTGHSGEEGLGENIFWTWTSGSVGQLDQYGTTAANSWQQEFQDFGWTSNILDYPTVETGIGHATQMVWSTTGAVGCGVKDCGPDPGMQNRNQVVVVCQYKTQGNIIDFPIYSIGSTCSECPPGTSCEPSSGLCA